MQIDSLVFGLYKKVNEMQVIGMSPSSEQIPAKTSLHLEQPAEPKLNESFVSIIGFVIVFQ
jgi:hypothetical protein